MMKRLSKRLPTTDQQVTSTIHAALEQGEGRPARIMRGSRPGVAGARLAPLSPRRPVSTAWVISLVWGPNTATRRAALRPTLGQYFASMRRIEELIQYRAQFKIVRLTTPAETHRADREALLEQSQQEQERNPVRVDRSNLSLWAGRMKFI